MKSLPIKWGASPIAMMLGGLLLVQASWVFALPAFSGVDEFDHVYRAAAVAHGQILAPAEEATRGTGSWMWVPTDIATAARAECQRLTYTSDADCLPSGRNDGLVRVASGAGRYNPAYYASVGWVSHFFAGSSAVYAMRGITALLAAGLFLGALVSLREARVSMWPVAGTVLAVSPVLLYSTAVVSPNGVEMMAGLAVWTSLTTVLRKPDTLARGPVAVILVASASVLAMTRSLGLIWLVGILLVCVGAADDRRKVMVQLVRLRRAWISAFAVAVSIVLGLAWTLSQRSYVIGVAPGTASAEERLVFSLKMVFVWMLQAIAAFPARNQPAPTIVYVVFGLLWCALMTLAFLRGSRRTALWGLGVVVAALSFATFVTFWTYNTYGSAWQGRYALPLTVGASMLAGLALVDRSSPPRAWLVIGAVLYTISHVVSVVNVHGMAAAEGGDRLLLPTVVSWPVVATLCTVGGLVLFVFAGRWASSAAAELGKTRPESAQGRSQRGRAGLRADHVKDVTG